MKHLKTSYGNYTLERVNIMEGCRIDWLADKEEGLVLQEDLPFKEDLPEFKGLEFAEGERVPMPQCRNAASHVAKLEGSTDQFGLCDVCAEKFTGIALSAFDTEAPPESEYKIGANWTEESKYKSITETDHGEYSTREWFKALVACRMKSTNCTKGTAVRKERIEIEYWSTQGGTRHAMEQLAGYDPGMFVATKEPVENLRGDTLNGLVRDPGRLKQMRELFGNPPSFNDQYKLDPVPESSSIHEKELQDRVNRQALLAADKLGKEIQQGYRPNYSIADNLARDVDLSTSPARTYADQAAEKIKGDFEESIIKAKKLMAKATIPGPMSYPFPLRAEPTSPLCEIEKKRTTVKAIAESMQVKERIPDSHMARVCLDLLLPWEMVERLHDLITKSTGAVFIGDFHT